MAKFLKLPNAGSSLTSSGCIPGSCGVAIWLGLSTPLSSSGCVVFFRTASAVSGCEVLPMIASPGQTIIYGPFSFPNGVFAASISGGCALVFTG